MKKGTKTIRKVFTGSNEYYVYDLDEDFLGKRKRLYGKTEGELKQKIEDAMNERKIKIALAKPKTKELSDYVRFYFKNAVGNIPSSDIKRLLNLFERAVFNSEIDKSLDEISVNEVEEFYKILIEKFPYQSVKEIDAVLKKTFELSNSEGISNIEIETIKVPENNMLGMNSVHILSPEEFNTLKEFCIKDNCTRYGSNERVLLFCIFTGLRFSQIKNLYANDIDLEKRELTINSKNKKQVISITEECADWLNAQALAGVINMLPVKDEEGNSLVGITRYTYDVEKPIFLNSNNVSPTLQSIQTSANAITRKCGLPKGVTSKTLNKSYVINQLENGATIEELCEYFDKGRKFITEIQDEYEIRKILF